LDLFFFGGFRPCGAERMFPGLCDLQLISKVCPKLGG